LLTLFSGSCQHKRVLIESSKSSKNWVQTDKTIGSISAAKSFATKVLLLTGAISNSTSSLMSCSTPTLRAKHLRTTMVKMCQLPTTLQKLTTRK